MTTTNPLLTIFIPTYNGAESCLDLVLDSVTRIALHYNDVEIIISDNCSSDNTQELCLSYKNNCPQLVYYRNTENIGFNYNMLKVTEYSHGEYAWIIGDDDVIELAYFDSIYQELKKKKIDLLSIGFCSATRANYTKIEAVNGAIVKYASFQEVIKENCPRGNTLCTFIGCTIFRLLPFNKLPKDYIENKFDCDYNIFPNAYFLVIAFHDKPCAYISESCITCVDSGRIKTYEKSLKGWITIDTKAIIELYNHFIECGVEKKYLKETKERIIYDYILMGGKMRKYGYDLPKGYFFYVLKLFNHPHVLFSLVKKTVNKFLNTDFKISV